MKEESSKGSHRQKGFLKIVLNLSVMAVVFFVLAALVMNRIKAYTRHGQHIPVPALVGDLEEDAATKLKAAGLTYIVEDTRYDPDMKAGQIIEQHPKAGSFVKEGRTIYITINSGKIPMRAVPDVADNSSLRAAESRLQSAGFRLTEPEYIPGDADWVYEVRMNGKKIQNGTEVPEGSLLTIVVGNGEDVPDIESTDTGTSVDSDFFN